MKLLFIFLILLIANLISIKSFSAEVNSNIADEPEEQMLKYNCSSVSIDRIPFKYCLRDLTTTNDDDIVFFFHGLGGDEKTWFTQYAGTLLIQKMWKMKNYRPRIATISFGPLWVLSDNSRSRLLPFFLKKAMPFLERKMGGLGRGSRHLIGQSMGGFNAAEVSLKSPGTFNRVALLCPAIATIGPYASPREIEAYIARTGASEKYVNEMLSLSRLSFVDQADWERHDPLLLLKKFSASKKSKYFVSVGSEDEYGFQEGAGLFAKTSRQKGFVSSWSLVGGAHCTFNQFHAADFFVRRFSTPSYGLVF